MIQMRFSLSLLVQGVGDGASRDAPRESRVPSRQRGGMVLAEMPN